MEPTIDGNSLSVNSDPSGRGYPPLRLSRLSTIFSDHIAGKIIVPYLVLVFGVAVLATHATINLIAGSLEDEFREELVSAGRAANEAMVVVESRQLSIVRQMAFTVGVPEALRARDEEALRRLLGPLAINAHVQFVDLYAEDGAHVVSLRSADVADRATDYFDADGSSWPPVRSALNADVDGFGDKFTGPVSAPWGRLLVTAGPVRQDGAQVGVISVALPLEEVLQLLAREAGSRDVTVYAVTGDVMATTVKGAPDVIQGILSHDSTEVGNVSSGGQARVRRVSLDDRPFVEVLGPLVIRREPALLLGVGKLVTAIEERGNQTRNTMVALFGSVILVVLALGLLLARRITGPVEVLVEAISRIRRNDLELHLPVVSRDETGVLTEAFNEMAQGLRERERSRVAIEKYMSPKVYELIQRGELRIGGESREITVLMTDIRSFTTLAEATPAEQLLTLLNRYFEAMFGPITKYEGEVDKYIGDGILAKFGATVSYPDHARRGVLAAIEMLEACDRLNLELQHEGLPELRMGIGANTGAAIVGNIGANERMEYTIISDAVNTAERVGSMCKELDWDLLISHETYVQAMDAIEVGEPTSVRLRGQTRDTVVYPVLGQRGAVTPERRQRYHQTTSRTWAGAEATRPVAHPRPVPLS